MTPIPRLPPFASGMRIGLLGGSFNPPHEGHALITRLALRRLALDRVWWLVTPGNPLKSLTGLAALNARIEAARGLDVGPRVVVTDIEAQIGSHFTYDTLLWLKRRAPGVQFVWIMGADNLRQFHLWRHWRLIAELTPIVVVDRPGSTLKAISSPAGAALARWRIPERDASRFATMPPPALLFLHGPRSGLSSTALRRVNASQHSDAAQAEISSGGVPAHTNKTPSTRGEIRRTPMNPSVLIVGAGPVGLTLACELIRYRVPVRIVDKAPQRTDKSKALVLWSRTLELLDRGDTGAAPFVEAGFKVDGVDIVAADRRVVGHVKMESVPSPYNYALMLPQSDTERLLEERLQRLGVSVERSTEATALKIGAGGVEATLRRADGREETAHADWLAGCDGAHSIVRHTLGAPFTGETMLSDWVLADTHMSGYPFPDTEVAVYWARDGVLPIFPIAPGRYRIIANVPPSGGDHPRDPTLEEIAAIVEQRGPKDVKLFDPIWLSGFRINARKVESYRSGRAFLSGDAAHVHSPAGGEGMNTGMQDAFNLAWKLALAIHGTCGEALLDTYSPERSGVGEEVLKNTSRLTAIGTLHNPVAEELRNLVGRVALGFAPVQHAVVDNMSQVSVGYPKSPMNGRGHGSFRPGPGQRMAPIASAPPFGAGHEPRFTLLASSSPAVAGVLSSFPKLLNAALGPPPDENGVWLIRPDGYVAATAPAADLSSISDVLSRMSA